MSYNKKIVRIIDLLKIKKLLLCEYEQNFIKYKKMRMNKKSWDVWLLYKKIYVNVKCFDISLFHDEEE